MPIAKSGLVYHGVVKATEGGQGVKKGAGAAFPFVPVALCCAWLATKPVLESCATVCGDHHAVLAATGNGCVPLVL
jgi:hypothetical protein